jgi:aminodeoxyfutalosine deaminase
VTEATRKPTVVDGLPKAELHLHLEGSIRPETAVTLASRHGAALTPSSVAARYSFKDFNGFIESFKWISSLLRTPEDYAFITRQLCEDLIRQKVVYAEVTISAGVMLRRGQDVGANFAAIREAASSVPFSRLRVAWILDAARQFGHEQAMEVARWASKLSLSGVVAFGMGGDELSFPAVHFRPAFQFAKSEGLHLLCHAGEMGGPESVREALDLLGAERIGHGIAVMHDPALAESMALRRIVLENCPTSNLLTGALSKQTRKPSASLDDHPLREFVKRKIPITLSSDDPGIFHTNLLSEYSIAASLGLTDAQLVEIAGEGFQAAFLPPQEKREMLESFHAAAKSAGLA